MQRRIARNDWLLPVVMAFDTLLIMSMVDGIFFHARMVMLVAFVNAVALALPWCGQPWHRAGGHPDFC